MSLSFTATVTCGGCGQDSETEVWASANVTLDPSLKSQLAAGTLNALACACGSRTIVEHNLLYHDMDQGYAVYLAYPDEDGNIEVQEDLAAAGQFFRYRQRIVTSWNALLEKIVLFDAGIDDRVVELIKYVLMSQSDRIAGRPITEIRCSAVITDPRGAHSLPCWLFFGEEDRPVRRMLPYDEFSARLIEALQTEPRANPRSDQWMEVDRGFGVELGAELFP